MGEQTDQQLVKALLKMKANPKRYDPRKTRWVKSKVTTNHYGNGR